MTQSKFILDDYLVLHKEVIKNIILLIQRLISLSNNLFKFLLFSTNGDEEVSNSGDSELKLFSPDKIESLELILSNMRKDQAYLGLTENLDWVLEKSADKCNDFNDACGFVQFIVGNNLYTEGYCVSITTT